MQGVRHDVVAKVTAYGQVMPQEEAGAAAEVVRELILVRQVVYSPANAARANHGEELKFLCELDIESNRSTVPP